MDAIVEQPQTAVQVYSAKKHDPHGNLVPVPHKQYFVLSVKGAKPARYLTLENSVWDHFFKAFYENRSEHPTMVSSPENKMMHQMGIDYILEPLNEAESAELRLAIDKVKNWFELEEIKKSFKN